MNTGFYDVFKQKLEKQKAELKKELQLAKSDRRKDWLRRQLKESKQLKRLLKDMEATMGTLAHCPHCKGKL